MTMKTKRKPLSSFIGILNEKSGDALEKSIMDARKRHRKLHAKRIERISREMNTKQKIRRRKVKNQ